MTAVLTLYAIALSYLRRSWLVILVSSRKPIFQNWQYTLVTANDRIDAVPNRPRNITVLVEAPHRHRRLNPALVRPLGDTRARDAAPATEEAV